MLTWEALDTESRSEFTSNAIGVSFGDDDFVLFEVRLIDARGTIVRHTVGKASASWS
jgi:hypothetical protein